MKRGKRDRKLETGLEAYAESVKANGAVENFFMERLRSWPVYAAAAGSALALSTSAMADIIHSPGPNAPALATGNHSKVVTFTHLAGYGTANLILEHSYRGRSLFQGYASRGIVQLSIKGGGGVMGLNFVSNLSKGHAINAQYAHGGVHTLISRAVGSTLFGGGVSSGRYGFRSGYAGFILPNGDPGWLKIQIQNVGHKAQVPDEAQILYWAIATNGDKITAGETQLPQQPPFCPHPEEVCGNGGISTGGGGGGTSNSGGGGAAVPEPSSLALSLLAMGSVAVLEWRRRRAGARQAASATK